MSARHLVSRHVVASKTKNKEEEQDDARPAHSTMKQYIPRSLLAYYEPCGTQLLNRTNLVIATMSPYFPSFFSSTQISERIAALREAEGQLFEFAKTRYFGHQNQEETSNKHHHFELFDTPIEVPSVVRKKKDDAAASCQVQDEINNTDKYSLHGVKVVNKRLLNGDGGDLAASSEQQPAAPLVLLHGYANGSLYFYRNLMGISEHFLGNVYALDLLGWGLSSRPKFDLMPLAAEEDGTSISDGCCVLTNSSDEKKSLQTKRQVSSAESFFVESLESWRRQHDLPKLTLAGHSMGGYLSVAYAEKYPQHVEKLILLSPVGVPERQTEDENRISSLPFYVRAMIKTARYLFNKGVTPGAFLRSLPNSKSKQMVDGYVLNRLPTITCPAPQRILVSE